MRPTEDLHTPRPIQEWDEEIGPVLWWEFPVEEPPYLGTPFDQGFPIEVMIDGESFSKMVGGWPGYHTHWTPLPDAAAVERLASALPVSPEPRQDDGMVTLTSDLLHAGGNGGCGFSRRQIEALGLPWPAEKGWLTSLVGKTIPRSQYDRFVSLRKRRGENPAQKAQQEPSVV
jgi:hypothetical protein